MVGITSGDMTDSFHGIIRIGPNLRVEDNTSESVGFQDKGMEAL